MTRPHKVNGLTNRQRERMCTGKVRYADELADIAGGLKSLEDHVAENGISKLYRYRCAECRGYHLTRKKQPGQQPITLGLDQFKVAA
jgi:ribosomal protein L44E